jgi:RNA polymerase sigma-70 factor (ECF subfamily)
MLFRKYPRLTKPPLNLQPDEMLSAVTERMLKAMREARPQTVRQFFALANQHMRWELNDVARRLDKQDVPVDVHDSFLAAPSESTASQLAGLLYWRWRRRGMADAQGFAVVTGEKP